MNKEVLLDQTLVETLIRNVIDDRDKLLIKIFYFTSCKANEIVSIKLSDLSENSLKISERVVPISKELYSDITNYADKFKLENSSFLFGSRQSDEITTKRVRQIIQKNSLSILGFKINPEDIRKVSIAQKIKSIEFNQVKEQVGLKRLDRRKFLSEDKINKINKIIKDRRTEIIFSLLLNGIKSIRLTKLKVNEVRNLKINNSLRNRLLSFAKDNGLIEQDKLFLTRQKSSLTKERIFQIISNLEEASGVRVSPRILNNTALAHAVSSKDETKLDELGVKTRSFHLHGGFVEDG